MRRDGQKLTKDEIRAGGKRGWLTFMKMPAGQPVWTAKLTGPNGGNVLPELMSATVTGVSGGILIQGLVERRGQIAPVRQAWYCEPTEVPKGFAPDGRPFDGRPRDGRRG